MPSSGGSGREKGDQNCIIEGEGEIQRRFLKEGEGEETDQQCQWVKILWELLGFEVEKDVAKINKRAVRTLNGSNNRKVHLQSGISPDCYHFIARISITLDYIANCGHFFVTTTH